MADELNSYPNDLNRLLFYFLMFVIYSFIFWIENLPVFGLNLDKGGLYHSKSFYARKKCLTIINLNVLVFYHFVCSLDAMNQYFLGHQPAEANSLGQFCNFMFISWVFPIGTIIAVAFISVIIFNWENLFKKSFDHITPIQNHFLFMFPFVSTMAEFFITKHNYNPSVFWGSFPTVIFVTAYFIWICVVAHFDGYWVYPIFGSMRWFQRFAVMFFFIVFTSALYKPGKNMNLIIWASTHY